MWLALLAAAALAPSGARASRAHATYAAYRLRAVAPKLDDANIAQSPVFEVEDRAGLSRVEDHIAQALQSPAYSAIHFHTPAWEIPMDMSEEPPYKDALPRINSTYSEYKEESHSVFVSANPASYLRGAQSGSKEELKGLGFGADSRRCSKEEAVANAAAKHVVIQVNFPEAGFFGHAIDNVFPRVVPVLRAARKAKNKVSVLLPPEARSFLSPNTQVLFQKMGVELLEEPPGSPHRAVSVSYIAGWDKRLRQALRDELHETVLRGVTPAQCESATGQRPTGDAVFISRAHGARNGRWVQGSEDVEAQLKGRGFKILDDPGGERVDTLGSSLLSKTCSLAGFAGTALLNLVFLPAGATVIEYNPTGLYADYWQWAHALGLHYAHAVPPGVIDKQEAASLADFAVSSEGGGQELRGPRAKKTVLRGHGAATLSA